MVTQKYSSRVRKHSKVSKPVAMCYLLNSTAPFLKGFCNLSKPQPLNTGQKSGRKLEQGQVEQLAQLQREAYSNKKQLSFNSQSSDKY